jgi:hypothetical protein
VGRAETADATASVQGPARPLASYLPLKKSGFALG